MAARAEVSAAVRAASQSGSTVGCCGRSRYASTASAVCCHPGRVSRRASAAWRQARRSIGSVSHLRKHRRQALRVAGWRRPCRVSLRSASVAPSWRASTAPVPCGDYCGDSASQRLDDDQAVRLDPGRQHQQLGRIPLLVELAADQRSRHRDAVRQPGCSDLGTQSIGVARISAVGADQVRRPGKVRELCQGAYQGELVFGRRQRGDRKEARLAAGIADCHVPQAAGVTPGIATPTSRRPYRRVSSAADQRLEHSTPEAACTAWASSTAYRCRFARGRGRARR